MSVFFLFIVFNSCFKTIKATREHGVTSWPWSEARLALAEAERREAEMSHALQSLQAKAEGADLKLQEQINAIAVRSSQVSKSGNASAEACATESDVVALRDWTKTVTTGHDARLRRIEMGLSAMAMSERSVGGGSGQSGAGGGSGYGSRGGSSRGNSARGTPRSSPLKRHPGPGLG